jgi:hypothetical protein
MYYRGHPKVNVFFYSLIFTLNHRRPKMSKFDTSDKKFIQTIGRWLLWRENYIAVRLASSLKKGVGKKTGLRGQCE